MAVEIGSMMHSDPASKIERLEKVDDLLNSEDMECGDEEVEQDYDYVLDPKMRMKTLSKSISNIVLLKKIGVRDNSAIRTTSEPICLSLPSHDVH